MARIWKEQHPHGGLPDSSPDVLEPIRLHSRAPTLIPHDVVFVSVCSFTFRFDSKHQLERVLEYYEKKTVASTRQPEEIWSQRGGDRWEAARWFEKLPLFLREEPKRVKVVKALRNALEMFEPEK